MAGVLIDEQAVLAELCERLARCDEIGLDVEGDGLFRYRSQLCTVQLASNEESGDEIAVLDTLALENRDPLARLLGPDGPTKIVHDASYDARLLRDHGIELGRIFDTSIAARFLGEPATGLASLVDKYFGVELSKAQQHSDWGRRPLDERALVYLEEDVRWLADLSRVLRAKILELGIEQEVAEEAAYVLRRARDEEPDTRPPWRRIKKWDELNALGRAVLREVAVVREETAERLDVPPFKVVGNDVLMTLATRRPHSMGALRQVRGMQRGRARRIAGDLLAAVRRGIAAGDVPEEDKRSLDRPVPPREEREAKRKRHKALGSWRKKVAAARGVDVQVVLPGHCLTDLAARGAATTEDLLGIDGIGDFRVERDGKAMLSALAR